MKKLINSLYGFCLVVVASTLALGTTFMIMSCYRGAELYYDDLSQFRSSMRQSVASLMAFSKTALPTNETSFAGVPMSKGDEAKQLKANEQWKLPAQGMQEYAEVTSEDLKLSHDELYDVSKLDPDVRKDLMKELKKLEKKLEK